MVTQGRAALGQGLDKTAVDCVYRGPWLLWPGMAVPCVCYVQGHCHNDLRSINIINFSKGCWSRQYWRQ